MRRIVVLGSLWAASGLSALAISAPAAPSTRATDPAPVTVETATAAAAPLGSAGSWTALQTHSGPDARVPSRSRLTYAEHRLCIEDERRVAILELDSGAVTYVDRATKTWARVTLEELVKMRDAKLDELEARIDALPESVREAFRAQLEAQMEADRRAPTLRPTNETDEVNGYACRVHRWTGPDGDGEVCIATRLPVDLSAFRADVEKLRARMEALGATRTVGSMDFLRLGDRGFPVRTRQKIQLGPDRTVDAESTFSDFEPVGPVSLEPPSAYEQVSYVELMRRVSTAAPRR